MNDRNLFYEPAKSALKDIDNYGGKLQCIDNIDDLRLWGNYNTPDTRNLMIVFDKCNNATSPVICKSDAEIKEWMRFKYILTYFNQKKLVLDKFEEDRVSYLATTSWLALNSESRTDYGFVIDRTHFDLNDGYLSIGSLTADLAEGFQLM